MSIRDNKLLEFFKRQGGIVRYFDIESAGFHHDTLRSLLRSRRVHKLQRAVYKLAEIEDLVNPDLVMTALKAPQGVVCLISALAFYEVTDEIPRRVDLAIPRGSHANKIVHPPVRYYRFGPETWKAGIEEHDIAGQKVRIYSLAKTLADCFKFRNRIGFDVAQKALKVAVSEKGVSPTKILEYAKICRVANIIRPYLESLL